MSTASGLDLARLAIVFDTSTAPTAISAMQQVVSASRGVGQEIDANTARQRANAKAVTEMSVALRELNQAHAAAASGFKRGSNDGAAYARTVQDIKRALDEEAKAMAMVANGHQQRAAAISRLMTQAKADYQSGGSSAKDYAGNLAKLQVEMDKIVGVQTTLATSGKESANSMALLTGAVGGFVGVLGFQAMAGLSQFAGFITTMPGQLAHAGDELERLSARLTFAYRGSADAARSAREDIIKIARETAMPYSQVAQGYGDLAIAGRGPGLSRQQIGGLAGAFPMLAQMTGSDNASTGRAMWQFQQALALGRLTSQDYRFMATNMPALDDALAAGMGVDVNTIPGRISRGEIDAQKMVDAMIKGVEILRESAGGLPETMERARGRIQTEWELLLTNVEERVRSSKLYQDAMGGVGQALRDSNTLMGGSAAEQMAMFQERLRRAELPRGDPDRIIVAGRLMREWREKIADLKPRAAADANNPASRMAGETDAARTRATDRRSAIGRANQAADSISTLDLQRADMSVTIKQLREGLAAGGAPLSSGDIGSLQAESARMKAEQERLKSLGLEDSKKYRDLVTSQLANKSALDSGKALPPEEVQRLQAALSGAKAMLAQMVSVWDRRVNDLGFAEQDMARYGPGAGYEIAQGARGLSAQAAGQGISLDPDNPKVREQIMRERSKDLMRSLGVEAGDLYLEKELAKSAGGTAAQRREAEQNFRLQSAIYHTYGQEFADSDEAKAAATAFNKNKGTAAEAADIKALGDRERADRERLEVMRQQLALGMQIGLQGKIASAQAQRELELRQQFPKITDEQIRLERDRVAELTRASDELEKQQRQFDLINDSAATAASTIRLSFSAAIHEGIEKGTVSGLTVLNVFAQSASRIIDNTLARMFDPMERQATDFLSSFLNNLLPGSSSTIGFTPVNTASAALSAPVIPHYASGTSFHPGGMAWVGEQGPELVNLPRGSGVIPNHALPSGGGVQINVIDQRSGDAAPVETRETKGPDGKRMIEVFVRDAVDGNLRAGRHNTAMKSQFGVQPQIRQE